MSHIPRAPTCHALAPTEHRAQKLGLRGWVRNSPDESVEGVAVGPSAKVEQLKQGPSAAEVKGVELIQEKKGISEEEAQDVVGGSSAYEVRR